MPVKLKEGLSILFDTIAYNLRHQDYKRVCDIAEDYTTYATGLNIDKKLKKFNGRESDDEFAQRVLITQCNTPDIFASCVKPLYKVGRTPAAVSVHWKDAEAAKQVELKKELYDAGKNFWGKKDVSKYITQRQADLEGTDPNSFVIVEFKGEVDPADKNTKASPYPFEANSAEAINYIYENNDLKWLVVLNKVEYKDGKGITNIGEKYFLYIDNEAVTSTQFHKDNFDAILAGGAILITEGLELKPKQDYIYITNEKAVNKRRYYVVRVFEHKVGFIPAKRFGSIYDPITRNRTCIPLIFASQSYFEKSIQAMSEFDLTTRCHVFPKLWQYADACPGEKIDKGWIHCDKGYQANGKTMCNACKGTGYKVHTSSQNIIYIRMPKELSEIVTLENMSATKAPPMDLITFQKEYGFEDLRRYAVRASYNSDVFSQQQIMETATSKVIDLDAVYDTLMPYADSWSEMYVFIYKCIAALRDINKNLTITHEFPKDFKMEPLTQLYDNLAKANSSGAPSHIKKSIVRDITNKMYIDQPGKILQIDTKDRYFPFPGKTESEINFILANDLTTTYNKILHTHFDLIFNEIEFEQNQTQKDFYLMDEKMQRDLIDKKVAELIEEIDTDTADAAATSFKREPELEKVA